MAAKINLKTIDFYRFKKLIIDGNRDDYNSCSKEVKALCDHVQTFNFRDEQFDEATDRSRFDEISCFYRQILSSKRINPIDMRIKSGWWADTKASTYSVGKIKPAVLKELLITKAKAYAQRQGMPEKQISTFSKKIDGPGIFVFKHKDRHCFQYVGRADKVFARCSEILKQSFEGISHQPLAALFIISLASDWEFYFTPVIANDEEKVLRILENDIILRHDCIWPHGLNFILKINSLLEVSEFRKSCIRHHWPPEGDVVEKNIDLDRIRKDIEDIKATEEMEGIATDTISEPASSAPSSRRSSITDVDVNMGGSAFEEGIDLSPTLDQPDRPPSRNSLESTATYTVDALSKAAPPGSQQKVTSAASTKSSNNSKALMGKENINSPRRPQSASKAKGARPTSGSPKKQKKPEWKGVLDDEENANKADDVDAEEVEKKGAGWSFVELSGGPERPNDLPIRSPRLPSSQGTPKKIPTRIASGKKRL